MLPSLHSPENCGLRLFEWEAGASDTQRSLRKEGLSYLLVAKIFMLEVKNHVYNSPYK